MPFGYEYLGEKTAKNIDKPLYAYRVLLDPKNSKSENQRKDSGNAEKKERNNSGASVQSSSYTADNPLLVATDRIERRIQDVEDDPKIRRQIHGIESDVQDSAGDVAKDPARRKKVTEELLKSKQAKFTLGFGLFLLAVNVFTSFGRWWFQYPFLVAGFVSYLAWMKNSFNTSKRIVSLRERIITEEMSRLSDRQKPTSREISHINGRITACVDFYKSLYIYIGVNAFFILINLFTTPFDWWFQFPLVGWGFFLFMHWFKKKKQFPEPTKTDSTQEST